MNRTRLHFKSIGEMLGGDGLGIVTLVDDEETHALNAFCDRAMKGQIALRNAPAGQRSELLPEVLVALYGPSMRHRFEIEIYSLVGEEYATLLLDKTDYTEHPMRLADAVLLHRIADIPVYIDANLFKRQGIKYDPTSNKTAIPLNIVDTAKVKEELQKAIDAENYRVASILRDELKRRGESTGQE